MGGEGDHSVEVKTLPPSNVPHQLVHFNWFRSFQESRKKNRIAFPQPPVPSFKTKGPSFPAYIAPLSSFPKRRRRIKKKRRQRIPRGSRGRLLATFRLTSLLRVLAPYGTPLPPSIRHPHKWGCGTVNNWKEPTPLPPPPPLSTPAPSSLQFTQLGQGNEGLII